MYMGGSFVHQAHSSAYSSFVDEEKGEVRDGFGRTPVKRSRMPMLRAIAKYGPSVTHDESGFLIKEGRSKAKGGRGREAGSRSV